MQNAHLRLIGTAPLLMHNAQLADPLSAASQALAKLTSKRTKTDKDHAEIAQVEHMGCLYLDPDVGPYIPGDNIWRCLWDASKKHKYGEKIKQGVFITTDINPLGYKGPRTAEGLWADVSFRHRTSVVINRRRTMRTRPLFRDWVVEADLAIDTNVISVQHLRTVIETAGPLVGLGDWRPRYGRFTGTLDPT